MDRRFFLRTLGVMGAYTLFVPSFLRNTQAFSPKEESKIIRIRGIVRTKKSPIAKVSVSDGLQVVQTNKDGVFELISDSRQSSVHISIPSGYNIPMNEFKNSLFYAPIQDQGRGSMEVVFDLEKSKQDETNHSFLVLADPQLLDDADVKRFMNETVPDVKQFAQGLPNPVFSVGCGDLVFDRLNLFPAYKEGIKEMGITSFQVLGNHDTDQEVHTDELSCRTFQSHFGPNYYSFNRGNIHYVVLDDVFWYGGYMGYLDQTQLDWLAADLSFVPPGSTVVVFSHIPIYNEQHSRYGKTSPENGLVVVNREALYAVLKSFKSYLISGHMHENEFLEQQGCGIHIWSSVCGAWWTADISTDGTPNGYAVYSVQGSSLSWQFKPTGKSIEHQIRLYPPGSDPEHPNDFIANVWSATNEWNVVWSEDDVEKGMMTRGLGKDPMAVKLFEGALLPERFDWVDPGITDHLYYAAPAAGVKKITVKATDTFGNTYTETLALI